MKNRVLGKIGHVFNLKMLSVVFLVICSVQIVQAADKAKRSKAKHEREKNIQHLIQRHHLWRLGYLLDRHSTWNQATRVRESNQEIIDIHAFAAQFKTKVDAFQTAVDNCHPSQSELKQELQAVHTQALLPIPDIMRMFFIGRIIHGTNEIKPSSYASTYALSQLFEPKSDDLGIFHKQLVHIGNTYQRRLKKNYSVHKKSGDMPDQEEGAILHKEYAETIVPFIGCFGVLADMHKRNPEAVEQAKLIWENTRDLELPKL